MKTRRLVWSGLLVIGCGYSFGVLVTTKPATGQIALFASGDSDGDGFTDEQEQAWNTDPQDSASSPDLRNQLAAWWPLDEGSGFAVIDVSGNGCDGLIQSSLSTGWTRDQSGAALSFDGGQNRVVVTDSPALRTSEKLTVAMWIRTTGDGVLLGKYGQEGKRSGYRFSIDNGRLALHLRLADREYPLFGQKQVADGAWHHVTLVYDGFETRLYVDGERDVATALGGAITATDGPVVIGEIAATVRDVALYTRAFSDGEVVLLYQLVSAPVAELAARQPTTPMFLTAWGQSRHPSVRIALQGAR